MRTSIMTNSNNIHMMMQKGIFYTCPLCGSEYLATFITKENGQTMCIDCWNKKYGD